MARKKKYMILTKEQIEFRDKLVKRKPRKERPLPPPPKTITRNEYMNNCIWWINECEAGRYDKEQLIKSVTFLRDYCNEIIQENKN